MMVSPRQCHCSHDAHIIIAVIIVFVLVVRPAGRPAGVGRHHGTADLVSLFVGCVPSRLDTYV
jgi:hypothetical protein